MAFTLKIVTLISVLFTIFFSARPVQADTPARLYLQNVPLQDEKLLVVNVQLVDVVDLYGAEVQFRYDPAQLRVRDDNPRLEGVWLIAYLPSTSHAMLLPLYPTNQDSAK